MRSVRRAALYAALNAACYCNMVLGSSFAACMGRTCLLAAARSSANDVNAATFSGGCGGQSATDREVRAPGATVAAERSRLCPKIIECTMCSDL